MTALPKTNETTEWLERELVRNALEHAQPATLNLHWTHQASTQHHERLGLEVRHDGRFVSPEQWAPGLGVTSVRRRVAELEGHCQWRIASPGSHQGPRWLVFEASWPTHVLDARAASGSSRGIGMASAAPPH